MTTTGASQAGRGVLVLSITHAEDVEQLRALEGAESSDAVLCLLPWGVEAAPSVEACWQRVAVRRPVVVLQHPAFGTSSPGGGAGADVLAEVCRVARWAAEQDEPALHRVNLTLDGVRDA